MLFAARVKNWWVMFRLTLGPLLRLAGPAIAGSLSYTLMHFINGWMVSRLDLAVTNSADKVNLAAMMNAGMMAFAPIAMALGVGSCLNTLASQSAGRGRPEDAARYAWQGLYMALGSILLFAPLALFGRQVYGHLSHSAELVRVEQPLFVWLLLLGPLHIANSVLGNYFLGMHKPSYQFLAALVGNAVDFIVGFSLILGHFGMPKMGLTGAAIATTCALLATQITLLGVFLFSSHQRAWATRIGWQLDLRRLWHLIRLGLPAGLQGGSDVLSWTIFSVWLVGQFGTTWSSAQSALMQFVMISFMPAIGVGNAVAALVGKRIGAKDIAGANAAASTGMVINMTYMGLCGVVFVVFREQLATFLLSDPEAIAAVKTMLLLAAAFQIFDSLNATFIAALRGAGDVVWPTIKMVLISWGICVGGGWLSTHWFPQAKGLGPWSMATLYVATIGIYVMLRWYSGRWRKIDVFR
jgi:MATE family multidrug resistance protein